MLQVEPEPLDYADAFESALEDLIDDLKSVMNKDLCKRVTTQTAFKFFDGWWRNSSQLKVTFPLTLFYPVDKSLTCVTKAESCYKFYLRSLLRSFLSE